MNAQLVFDHHTLHIPESMGVPAHNQLRGTDFDNLGELSSRICYDSLGKGRSSQELHKHIKDVRNHSIYEHINITLIFDVAAHQIIVPLLNRKGVWLEQSHKGGIEVTVNMRTLLEWKRHTKGINNNCHTEPTGIVMQHWANKICPMIIDEPEIRATDHLLRKVRPKPLTDLSVDQAWISLYLYGSRGFTHEQVRHRFAMSQRSTRYVDESESEYIVHPLVKQFLEDTAISYDERQQTQAMIDQSVDADRATYRMLVRRLKNYLELKGMEGTAARKQARGAARGFLGNALASEMIFSAPASGWLWILSQRANKLADAEIRAIYEPALAALKQSAYGHFFNDLILVPSPDGMGKVLLD